MNIWGQCATDRPKATNSGSVGSPEECWQRAVNMLALAALLGVLRCWSTSELWAPLVWLVYGIAAVRVLQALAGTYVAASVLRTYGLPPSQTHVAPWLSAAGKSGVDSSDQKSADG